MSRTGRPLVRTVRDIKSNDPVAIHGTALTKDDPPKRVGRMSFGSTSGGAIKRSLDCEVHSGLMIGEGIETVLGESKQFQFKPVWPLIDRGISTSSGSNWNRMRHHCGG